MKASRALATRRRGSGGGNNPPLGSASGTGGSARRHRRPQPPSFIPLKDSTRQSSPAAPSATRAGIWRCAMLRAPRQLSSLPLPNWAKPTARANSGLDKTWGQGQFEQNRRPRAAAGRGTACFTPTDCEKHLQPLDMSKDDQGCF
jgi:hypothetical protein